jgi:hypothetical protein
MPPAVRPVHSAIRMRPAGGEKSIGTTGPGSAVGVERGLPGTTAGEDEAVGLPPLAPAVGSEVWPGVPVVDAPGDGGAVGPEVAVEVGAAVGFGVATEVGTGVGGDVGTGVGFGVGLGVGFGVGFGVGVGVGEATVKAVGLTPYSVADLEPEVAVNE